MKAPHGAKAMGALAQAACASFLVEAFHSAFFGNVLHIGFLGAVGGANGSLGGVAAAVLVPLALGVSPVYAVMAGLAVSGLGILPGFVAGYLVSYVILYLEKRLPPGVDLIAIILVAAPLSRGIALLMKPVGDHTLLAIGQVLTSISSAHPIFMGILLGGIIVVVATAPLSSMALTAMMGLTGMPMAIGALAVFGSSFMNFVLFKQLKIGSMRDTISVAIEPLTQADLISANPIPVYGTNFIGGALCGICIALMGLVNNTPGTATPIAGFAVMFAYNDWKSVLEAGALCILLSVFAGFLGSWLFRKYPLRTAAQVRQGHADVQADPILP
ncbi:MAG: PTS sugar transporter subunit IIC [Zoogloeaceae bacterium]|nr:PTS sugar transporter subunit IIC [Zoogloeaceae bacterium]